MLEFCDMCTAVQRILRRIGQRAPNWLWYAELTKRHRNCRNFAEIVLQYCS